MVAVCAMLPNVAQVVCSNNGTWPLPLDHPALVPSGNACHLHHQQITVTFSCYINYKSSVCRIPKEIFRNQLSDHRETTPPAHSNPQGRSPFVGSPRQLAWCITMVHKPHRSEVKMGGFSQWIVVPTGSYSGLEFFARICLYHLISSYNLDLIVKT